VTSFAEGARCLEEADALEEHIRFHECRENSGLLSTRGALTSM